MTRRLLAKYLFRPWASAESVFSPGRLTASDLVWQVVARLLAMALAGALLLAVYAGFASHFHWPPEAWFGPDQCEIVGWFEGHGPVHRYDRDFLEGKITEQEWRERGASCGDIWP